MFGRQNPLLGYWRSMCEFPTAAEKSLEPAIAKLGEKYRHQYPFWPLKYFADFALLDRKLIIEVDGDSHDKPSQKEKDLIHELQVLDLGWIIYRCTNEQAVAEPEKVVRAALDYWADFACPAWPDWSQSKEALRTQLTAALSQLHQDYPALLAAAAKQATKRSRSAKVGAARRAKARGSN